MKFTETPLKDAFILDPERFEDSRGFFARSWCDEEFGRLGLNSKLVQCNISYNKNKGTLRGLHFQTPPYDEVKIVRCTMGAVFDVIVDTRKNSPSYKKWFGIELTAENRKCVYIPDGFAHGYISLCDHSELFYQMSQYYSPKHGRGYRWNDPTFNIVWPLQPTCLSERDRALPFFESPEARS